MKEEVKTDSNNQYVVKSFVQLILIYIYVYTYKNSIVKNIIMNCSYKIINNVTYNYMLLSTKILKLNISWFIIGMLRQIIVQ